MADCTCNNFPAGLGNVTFGGQVGINKIPTWRRLDVLGDPGNVCVQFRTPGGYGPDPTYALLIIERQEGATGKGVGAMFDLGKAGNNAADVGYGYIGAVITNNDPTQYGGALVFHTAEGGVLQERARMASDGKVGIGTPTPSEKLDVNGSVNVPESLTGGVPSYGYRRNGALLGRGLSLVVAAANATAAEKAGADYICTGSQDQLVIQQAINALFSSSHGGGTVQLTSGAFNLTSAIMIWKLGATADVTKAVHLVGVGRGATVLRASTPLIDAIQVGFAPVPGQAPIKQWYVTIQGLSIDSPVDGSGNTIKTDGAGIWFMNTVRCAVYDVAIEHQFYGIRLGRWDPDPSLRAGESQLTLDNMSITDTKPLTGVAVLVDALSDFSMTRVVCINDWPRTDHPEKRARAAVELRHGGADIRNCDFISFYEDLLINPGPNQYVENLFCEDSNFDVNTNAGVRFAPSGNGEIRRVFFSDCWMASSDNNGVWMDHLAAEGAIANVGFSNCFVLNNRHNGLHVGNFNKWIQIVGCHMLGPGAPNTGDHGVFVGSNALFVQVKGNYIGPGRLQGSFAYGVKIMANSERWSLEGNTIAQCTGAGIQLDKDTPGGKHKSFVLLGNDLHQSPIGIDYDPTQLEGSYVFDHNLQVP